MLKSMKIVNKNKIIETNIYIICIFYLNIKQYNSIYN